jgi:hypothetical protein
VDGIENLDTWQKMGGARNRSSTTWSCALALKTGYRSCDFSRSRCRSLNRQQDGNRAAWGCTDICPPRASPIATTISITSEPPEIDLPKPHARTLVRFLEGSVFCAAFADYSADVEFAALLTFAIKQLHAMNRIVGESRCTTDIRHCYRLEGL